MGIEEQDNVETIEEVVSQSEETVVNAQVDAGEPRQSQDINWARANDTMSTQASELKEVRAQLSELRSAQAEAKKKGLFDGRDGSDLLTVDEFNRALEEKENAYNAQIAELKTQTKHKDYAEVLNKYGKQLPAEMIQAIKYSPNPHETAYVFCKNSPEYINDHRKDHGDIARIEANLSKPGNASAAGSDAVVSNGSKYKTMSSNDIMALHRRFAAGA